ncbi:MAG: hypothetical protein H0T88_08515 [Lysobacter sp.]|nr:hypothetical protein [Lysobacter sp.]
MLTVIVLPGLNGSAALRERFAAALRQQLPVRLVDYPPDVEMGFDALQEWLQGELDSTSERNGLSSLPAMNRGSVSVPAECPKWVDNGR